MKPDDWAQLGSAVFAAVAAGASWASVLQARGERKAQQTPDVHMEVGEMIPSGRITLTFRNFGGPAKAVKFWVEEGGVVAYGAVPPASMMGPGETRRLRTGLMGTGRAEGRGVVFYFDGGGRIAYGHAMNGRTRSWRFKRRWWRDLEVSDAELVQSFYPDADLDAEIVGYEVAED